MLLNRSPLAARRWLLRIVAKPNYRLYSGKLELTPRAMALLVLGRAFRCLLLFFFWSASGRKKRLRRESTRRQQAIDDWLDPRATKHSKLGVPRHLLSFSPGWNSSDRRTWILSRHANETSVAVCQAMS